MTHVSRTITRDASPDEMWGRIGDFQAADSWHPAIEASAPDKDGTVRELTIAGGGKIVETRIDEGPRSYGYRIDSSPLPVQDYTANLAVTEAPGGGCEVHWDADFRPAEGASDAEASEVIGGIFDAGLNNL